MSALQSDLSRIGQFLKPAKVQPEGRGFKSRLTQ